VQATEIMAQSVAALYATTTANQIAKALDWLSPPTFQDAASPHDSRARDVGWINFIRGPRFQVIATRLDQYFFS